MKKLLLIPMLIAALLFSTSSIAQEDETSSYSMAMVIYMYANTGMETDFEAAVKEHNATFHKDGIYKGWLDNIISGDEAGWYVWVMGPCTFTDLDSAPGAGEHADHWKNTVAPNIKKYGRQEYWKYNDDLSYQSGDEDNSLMNIWFVEIKRGDNYRFKALMTKIKEAYVKKADGGIRVYDNQFHGNDGRDIAIVWDLKNFAELDDESGSIKKDYEEINGEGSWNTMLDEWEEISVSVNSQLWRTNIAK